MANTSELLVSLGIDTKGFDSALKNVTRQTKNLEQSFKESNKALQLSEKSMQDYQSTINSGKNLINQYKKQLDSLNDEYEKGKAKLESYAKKQKELPNDIAKAKEELKQIAKELGKGSDEYEQQKKVVTKLQKEYSGLDGKIANTVNAMNKLENQMQSTNNKIKITEDSVDKLSDSINDLGEGFNGTNIGSQISEIAEKFGELGGKVGKVVEIVAKLGKAFVNLGLNSIQWLGKSLGNIVKMSAKIGTVIAGIGGVSVKTAGEFSALNSLFSETFGDLEKTAVASMNRVAKETGIVSGRLKEGFTRTFMQLKGSGIEGAKALGLTEKAMRLTADAAAAFDIPMEEANELLRSFIRGNSEAGDRLGLFTSETQRNTDAVNKYGKKWSDLTEAQKQNLMLDTAEKLYKESGAFGQAIKEADGLENVIGNLKYTIKEFLAILGENMLEPAIKGMKNFTLNLLEAGNILREKGLGKAIEYMVAEMVEALNGMANKIPIFMTNVINAMGIFIQNSAPQIFQLGTSIVTKIGEGIVNNKEAIANGITNLVGQIANFIVTNIPIIMEAGRTILNAISEGISNNMPVIKEAVYQITTTAVSLFLEYKGLIIEAGLEVGGSFFKGIWEGIWKKGQEYRPMNDNYYISPEASKEMGLKSGKEHNKGVEQGIKQGKSLVQSASKEVGTESSKAVLDALKNLTPETYNKMLDVSQKIRQSATDMYNGAKYSFSMLGKASKEAMTDMYKGVGTSMYKTSQKVRQEASNLYNGAKTSFVNIANVGLNQFSRLYNGATTSMSRLKNNVISSWNSMRSKLSKPIQGRVSVSRSISTQQSREISDLQSISDGINPNQRANPLDNVMYKGRTYQAQEVFYGGSNGTRKYEDSTVDDLREDIKMLVNILGAYIQTSNNRDINLSVNLDSKVIARGTAPYINKEIEKLNRRKSRLAGATA